MSPKAKIAPATVEEPVVPVEGQPVDKKKTSKPKKSGVFGLLDGAVILLLAGGGYMLATATASALREGNDVASGPELTATPTVPPLPTLNVSESRERRGPEVELDGEDIGRENPFNKP